MRTIETLAENFLAAYYAKSRTEYRNLAKRLIREIEKNQWLFRGITDYYIVAKALYYLHVQDEDEEISIEDSCTIYKIMYYLLLKSYLALYERKITPEFINSSKLMVIILCEQCQYLMNSVLIGELLIMPNYAQKHIGDQLKLFGGITKEGESIFNEDIRDTFINERYAAMTEELKQFFPSNSALQSYKQGCLSAIQNIVRDIETGLVFPDKDLTVSNKKEDDDLLIQTIERYSSWREYRQKHPLRAKEIEALGINLATKSDEDASEWIFSIETTAHDSKCKISELKQKYFDLAEKHNLTEADWIYLLKTLVKTSKKESEKYNIKIGNTAGDMMLLFVFDKIKEIESKYQHLPKLTTSDPLTLHMRFMLDSHDDVLILQKMHIYLQNYPLTGNNKQYRENWHNQMMSIIEKRISKYSNVKDNPLVYNMAVDMEISKFIYDEVLKDVSRDLLDEFNSHLLSFHEEMDIISRKASKKYHIK